MMVDEEDAWIIADENMRTKHDGSANNNNENDDFFFLIFF